MFVPMGYGHPCEFVARIEQQLNRMMDCYFEREEVERAPLRSGVRAREDEKEVVVEVAFPFEVTPENAEVMLRGRMLVVRYAALGEEKACSFCLELWCEVDVDRARATAEGNVLQVRLPKVGRTVVRVPVEED
ncbi:MAG: Hsp20/alpha crystallin family protein [Planctomycetota bacterium]